MIRLLPGDCRSVLATLPAESVHCVVCSPPYYGLRSYLDAEHPDKHREIGSEASPDEYLATMVQMFREVRRVLRRDGTCWVNMGDSYARNPAKGGSGPNGKERAYLGENYGDAQAASYHSHQAARPLRNGRQSVGRIKEKDLLLMPARLALALQAPYYAGNIKSEADRIWLAAIIDGEGCFFIHKRKAGTSAYTSYTRADGSEANYARTADTYGVGLEIANTCKAMIDRVAQIVPGGTFVTQGPEQNDRRKQTIYRWRVGPNEVKRLAQELYPHLVAKQHQARLVFSCPSNGGGAAAAHQAMMDLHNGVTTAVDYPAPPSVFEPGWFVRSAIVWSKPNPMPESCTDRPTSAHEHVFLLTKSGASTFWTHRDHAGTRTPPPPDYRWVHTKTGEERDTAPAGWDEDEATRKLWRRINLWRGHDYFYDADAVREEAIADNREIFRGAGSYVNGNSRDNGAMRNANGKGHVEGIGSRNLRNVWTIATQAYSEAHFATFPAALAERCIRAGTSQAGCCSQCGAPWVRVTDTSYERNRHGHSGRTDATGSNGWDGGAYPNLRRVNTTTGWAPSCSHAGDPVPATVLDPFAGAGTTLLVSDRLQRDAIGIELNPAYTEMAMARCRADAPLFADLGPVPEPPEEQRQADMFAPDEYQRLHSDPRLPFVRLRTRRSSDNGQPEAAD